MKQTKKIKEFFINMSINGFPKFMEIWFVFFKYYDGFEVYDNSENFTCFLI